VVDAISAHLHQQTRVLEQEVHDKKNSLASSEAHLKSTQASSEFAPKLTEPSKVTTTVTTTATVTEFGALPNPGQLGNAPP
jgi:hypothetical protein